jgi:hypothetical protein
MQKIIKLDKTVIVLFEDGSYLQRDDVTEEEFNNIINNKDNDEEVFKIMNPQYSTILEKVIDNKNIIDKVNNSKILTMNGDSVYWMSVSRLSLPTELVKCILCAEENNDEVKLDTYKNFWTLMSLNPDEECRKNLFWFLERNGLIISRCGFFVAYRNVVPTKEKHVYTDAHSGTTKIEIGKVVTMPRENCDSNSDVTCSRGLVV